MKRRTFISLLGGAAAAWPLAVRAQPTSTIPKIGVLWHAGSAEEEALFLKPFLEGLADRGYVNGQNVEVLNTFAAEQYERFNSNAMSLIATPVDILVAVTYPAAAAAQRATKTIPIVFVAVPDPVRTNLVSSLSHPGGNITGFTPISAELNGKRLEIFKDATGLSHGALLANVSDPANARLSIADFQAAASALKITLEAIEVRAPSDLGGAFDLIAQKGLRGVITQPDPMLYNERKTIAELALTRRIATMGFVGQMAKDGMLLSYGTNYPTMFRRVGTYVEKILKGEKPGDLPVEQPTKFELIVNLKTAKALGITVPQSLLVTADDVIA